MDINFGEFNLDPLNNPEADARIEHMSRSGGLSKYDDGHPLIYLDITKKPKNIREYSLKIAQEYSTLLEVVGPKSLVYDNLNSLYIVAMIELKYHELKEIFYKYKKREYYFRVQDVDDLFLPLITLVNLGKYICKSSGVCKAKYNPLFNEPKRGQDAMYYSESIDDAIHTILSLEPMMARVESQFVEGMYRRFLLTVKLLNDNSWKVSQDDIIIEY